jgi:drug/metabolite transporter (DMT)-like permease
MIENYRFFFITAGPSVTAMVIKSEARALPRATAQVRSSPMLIGAALGIVYVVWGSTYLAIRIMVGEMPPLLSAGFRFLTAGLLVAVALVARGGLRRMAVTGRELAGCALIGVLLPVLGQGLVTIGEKGGARSGITALLIAAVPLWVICYRILSGERPARRTLTGVFLGFGGVAVVIAANGAGGGFPPWTIAVVVLAGLSWALGSWCQPRLRLPGDPFVVVIYEMLVGGGVLTVAGLACGERFRPLDYSARSWVAWAYLVVFGSVVAFSAYVWLLQVGGCLAGRHVRVCQSAGGHSPGLADPRRTGIHADDRRRSGRRGRRCHSREFRTPPGIRRLADTRKQNPVNPDPELHAGPRPGRRTVTSHGGQLARSAVATFVLIHGAGDVGWYWHLVAAELRARGHMAIAPDLPCDDDSAGLPEYADAVVGAIGDRTNLIVVAQSFGGFTAPLVCDRVAVDLLVLVAPMIPAPAEAPADYLANTRYEEELRNRYDGAVALFYQDVPPELAAEARKRTRTQSEARIWEPSPLRVWPEVPTRVLICRDDRLFPAGYLRRVARERLGITPDELDGGHAPALSRPRELADRLEAYAAQQGLLGGH